ncbi:two-component system, chemotaxis family, response regulator CheV [Allopseudospirillum japonicum]|uniref:Two-component system, chemotaxis family, response regulator CheV n=1 Tax=Allopseudospirillum japonicum TaxID=64971 RepID=A0A1H6QD72_9GAMM|nr:chemotaxis protein CheV [Allopseudospirillum japonicum]SEI37460.1 two-component system, chemotaxis family, response regulator CheV [Allopseudospirillum japonicum]
MSKLLNSVNQRTQLAGENRLELLLFRLENRQLYGINVFKVKKIMPCPHLTQMPYHHPITLGVANTMDGPLPILDLLNAIGTRPSQRVKGNNVIVTEYNRRLQGFLVDKVEHIINIEWSAIHPPPKGVGKDHYLTAISRHNNEIVEIIDVEKIIAEISPANEELTSELGESLTTSTMEVPRHVLVVDDSVVARNQIKKCLESVNFTTTLLKNGAEAHQHLQQMVAEGRRPQDEYLMMISDIEMPEMDGYTLTRKVKEDANLKSFYVLLHTSLSGVFNKNMVQKVGANDFLAKFDANELANAVLRRLEIKQEDTAIH